MESPAEWSAIWDCGARWDAGCIVGADPSGTPEARLGLSTEAGCLGVLRGQGDALPQAMSSGNV